LYRIGYNCAVDHLRARPRHESAESPEMLAERSTDPGVPAVDDLVYAKEIGQEVQTALNELTPQERAAFLLRHYDGCSIDEICRALDLKASAAKHAVFRAVKKMRVVLRPLLESQNPRPRDGADPAAGEPTVALEHAHSQG
jgi:RNA polymerase sigma-70 factor (ECF subfamily)